MHFFDKPPLQYVTGPRPHYAFIWLHGLGADGHDFASFVEAFADTTDQAVRFILPHAPVQAVTLNGGTLMPAWFDLYGTRAEDAQDETGIRRAAEAITHLIAEQEKYGIPAERVVLGGFSQGGAVALYTALTGPKPLAAVIGLSTYLPLARHFLEAVPPINTATPVFLGHGIDDAMIPYPFAEKTRGVLGARGVAVAFHTYPIDHSVSDAEIRDLHAFLTETLGGADLGASSVNR